MKKFILILIFAFIAVVCSAQYRDEYKSIASEPATQEQVVAMSNIGSFTPIDLQAINKAQKDIRVGKTLVGVGAGIAVADVALVACDLLPLSYKDEFNTLKSENVLVVAAIGAASATTIIIGVVKWCRGEKAVKRLSATSGGLAFNF